MTYSDFSKKYLSIKEIEDFEKEDDGSEWEWNLSAITILQKNRAGKKSILISLSLSV